MKLSGEFLYADDHTESFKGDETEAINRFMVFPWEAQLREAELLKKCSPTISIEYPEKARVLWASVIEKDKEPEFLVHFEDSASDTISESDGIALSALPNLIRQFYHGEFNALANDINKPLQEAGTTRSKLVKRLLALELFPIFGALGYGYFYPRYVFVAFCVYALLALSSVIMSIREGIVLEKYGIACERSKDRFGFWFNIFVHAFFPILILSIAVAFPRTIISPPK